MLYLVCFITLIINMTTDRRLPCIGNTHTYTQKERRKRKKTGARDHFLRPTFISPTHCRLTLIQTPYCRRKRERVSLLLRGYLPRESLLKRVPPQGVSPKRVPPKGVSPKEVSREGGSPKGLFS